MPIVCYRVIPNFQILNINYTCSLKVIEYSLYGHTYTHTYIHKLYYFKQFYDKHLEYHRYGHRNLIRNSIQTAVTGMTVERMLEDKII